MVYDFHSHTCLSDGALSPLELVRRAHINGYRVIALTDHVGTGYLGRLISEIAADCALARKHWDIIAIPGVELTHVPSAAVSHTAKIARELGARVVVVHGQTPAEPVEPGTNLAAVTSPYVDILAHPGLITLEEARLAAANGVYLEITGRTVHGTTNMHVAEMARLAGAGLLINSDSHDEMDLLTPERTLAIAGAASLTDAEIETTLKTNPVSLISKILGNSA